MNKIYGISIMLALAAAIFSGPMTVSSFAQSTNSTMNMDETIAHSVEEAVSTGLTSVRDSAAILLEGKTLPAGDFIHLYDSTPSHIMNGHIAVKVACDEEQKPVVSVLIGQAPNLVPAELEYISELSQPGKMCLYHVDLMSTDENVITDIAIKNDGTEDIVFGPTSSVVIGVNQIMVSEHEAHGEESHGEETEGHSEEE
ncbi:MAG: hypothetical protein DA328_07100 [Nitrososphaeraceae archaeon]|nr:hypothetical protein [Nitrososphaeraceae archaeon]